LSKLKIQDMEFKLKLERNASDLANIKERILAKGGVV